MIIIFLMLKLKKKKIYYYMMKKKMMLIASAFFAIALSVSGCSATGPGQANRDLDPIILATPSNPPATSEPEESEDSSRDRWVEIDIDDQSGDGKTVVIESLEVSRVSFLVIFDREGSVLAAAEVSPQSQPVSITLDKSLSFSQELLARLYKDDGDGVFDINLDMVLVDDENEIAEEDFEYRLQD